MPNRTITIRGVPDALLERLRAAALANHRSLNGELVAILERAADESREARALRVRGPATQPYDQESAARLNLVDAIDREALAALCRRHHIRRLAVFGSHARGDARPESDVDVVVDFEPGMTPGLGIVAVAEALRPVFGNRAVDLVTRRGLSPRVRERVLATAKVLYAA